MLKSGIRAKSCRASSIAQSPLTFDPEKIEDTAVAPINVEKIPTAYPPVLFPAAASSSSYRKSSFALKVFVLKNLTGIESVTNTFSFKNLILKISPLGFFRLISSVFLKYSWIRIDYESGSKVVSKVKSAGLVMERNCFMSKTGFIFSEKIILNLPSKSTFVETAEKNSVFEVITNGGSSKSNASVILMTL